MTGNWGTWGAGVDTGGQTAAPGGMYPQTTVSAAPPTGTTAVAGPVWDPSTHWSENAIIEVMPPPLTLDEISARQRAAAEQQRTRAFLQAVRELKAMKAAEARSPLANVDWMKVGGIGAATLVVGLGVGWLLTR